MPVYSTPDEYSNGYIPPGSALPKKEGFDAHPPKGTNPPPITEVEKDSSPLSGIFSPEFAYGLPVVLLLVIFIYIFFRMKKH
ncbi:hypothetical protein ACFDZY_002750 [Salmonella enterica]